jgi:hypothetical protein
VAQRGRQTDSRYPGPTLRDWALAAVGLLFVAGALLVFQREPAMAVGTIALFGACAALGVRNVVRKRRFARLRPLSVEIVGGVPLRPSRLYTALLGGGVLSVGLALVPPGLDGRLVLLICAGVMVLAGAFLLGGVAKGKLPIGFVQFDEGGLTVGQRTSTFTIGWDNVLGVWPGEFHDNAVLFLSVRDLAALAVHPAEAKARTMARLSLDQRVVGAHVMILTGSYGIDLPLLVAAIEGYVSDPASRAGLAVPRLSAAARPSGRDPSPS